jgi:peptidoglycan hydrolase-like protein with peptidoglycan-binding domain
VRDVADDWARRLGPEPIAYASRKIGPGDSGSDVEEFQRHLTKRLRARSLPTITADGDYGKQTERARREVTRLLGFPASVVHRDGATPRVQKLVKDPSKRPKSYLVTAKKRKKQDAART